MSRVYNSYTPTSIRLDFELEKYVRWRADVENRSVSYILSEMVRQAMKDDQKYKQFKTKGSNP